MWTSFFPQFSNELKMLNLILRFFYENTQITNREAFRAGVSSLIASFPHC